MLGLKLRFMCRFFPLSLSLISEPLEKGFTQKVRERSKIDLFILQVLFPCYRSRDALRRIFLLSFLNAHVETMTLQRNYSHLQALEVF